MNYTPDTITSLLPNQIFVFGSNTEGRHGRGAALQALKWGAIYGEPRGLQGQTYALITKDLSKGQRSYPFNEIEFNILQLYVVAQARPHLEFLVTKIGTGLGGYTTEEIALLFIKNEHLRPKNVILPKEFHRL